MQTHTHRIRSLHGKALGPGMEPRPCCCETTGIFVPLPCSDTPLLDASHMAASIMNGALSSEVGFQSVCVFSICLCKNRHG